MKEYVSVGSIANLPIILKNKQNIFFITGKTTYKKSGIAEELKKFRNKKIVRFDSFSKGPAVQEKDVSKAVIEFKKDRFDAILAIGGGSIIDMGKLVKHTTKSKIPLVAIPTTAGSGSEATKFAVLYINNKKHSIEDKNILPNFTIVDPKFTYSLSSRQTAISGMDALTQAIESFWSINATKESRKYALKAMELIFPFLEGAVQGDKSCKQKISLGSHLAGKAINISKTTVCHAVSYGLTTQYGIPHGHAVALSLPKAIIFNSARATGKPNKSTTDMTQIFSRLNANNAVGAANNIIQLMKKVGLETTLDELGATDYKVMDHVNLQRLKNNPRELSEKDLINLFK